MFLVILPAKLSSLLVILGSFTVLFLSSGIQSVQAAGSSQRLQVIYAINAGGEAHTDIHGISYRRDPLLGRGGRGRSGASSGDRGTASAFGRTLLIARSPISDQILYQTERYHTSTFGYDIPVSQDGPYVLVLKFCEVYFDAPGQKIFDVVLNGDHSIVENLDIYARVGRGVALDIMVPFKIKSNKLFVNGEVSTHAGSIRVDFVKGKADNPKVNAVVVLKGTPDMVPELLAPPLDDMGDPHGGAGRSSDEDGTSSSLYPPTASPPYGFQEGASLLPVFAAIGAFVPIVFCLCRI
ncbi:malectin-A-like isoform X2 [Varroa jacobsoni]|uniref:Malectin domain-containing protein n=1 Tax=Varroa destructor TaxID=109461 RepID=A0A7M7IZL9_VARDE|nr:malectin-A-like isoform X1 [Varroa destructor]XP_022689130.1 malectin-A-like isoform X2 [Varroa jacobsoni]XP_022689131.1 malectin-A-like isoform X2 [Varroa jacobsoni]